MLELKLKMNHALGLQSKIDEDSMNILQNKGLDKKEFMQNVEVNWLTS